MKGATGVEQCVMVEAKIQLTGRCVEIRGPITLSMCMYIYCIVYTMMEGEIVLIGWWWQRGEGNEKVRDCGARDRIKVISINKGMKKSHIGRAERKKVENL